MNLEELLKIIVCPQCKGQLSELRSDQHTGLLCGNCQVVYPVRDQIPVLLTDEAIPQQEWEKQGG